MDTPEASGLSYLNRLLSERLEQTDRAILRFRRRWDAALDAIGGIKRLVGGKTVTVKVNMTGPAFRDNDGQEWMLSTRQLEAITNKLFGRKP
jgi:hypothetical protein